MVTEYGVSSQCKTVKILFAFCIDEKGFVLTKLKIYSSKGLFLCFVLVFYVDFGYFMTMVNYFKKISKQKE